MKTFALSFLGGLAALFLFFVVLPIVLVISFLPKEPEAPKNVVISLDLRNTYNDQPSAEGFSGIFSSMSHVEILLRLNSAVTDPNVKGVYIRAAESGFPSTRAEELREAIKRLRANGKFVIAHSQGFVASGPAAYRAISAADEIYIQPGSSFEAPGVAFETLFFGRLFQNFHVTADIEQFHEFKNAADTYKQNDYTPPHREAMTTLATTVWQATIADVGADRGEALKAAAARIRGEAPGQGVLARRIAADNQFSALLGQAGPLMERSPYTSGEAVALGLFDKEGWPEDVADAAKARAGGDAKLVDISDYQPRPARRGSTKAVVAIVGGEGDIVNGGGGAIDPLNLGAPSFASDAVARRLLDLEDDDDVKAVIFRVDSGGGSATASEQIWRAVERLKAKGKKVIVSMGTMAASGGYYVAANADAIVANRSTITGSIGVFGGKIALGDTLREYGVNAATIKVGGDFAAAYSLDPFTSTQRAALHQSLEAVYDHFVDLVDRGRKDLDNARVREIARGRVWSGEDALRLKLVDKNGDLIVAINTAKELLGLTQDDRVEIRMPVNRQSPFDLLTRAFTQTSTGAERGLVEAVTAIVGRERALRSWSQIRRLASEPGQVQAWTPTYYER